MLHTCCVEGIIKKKHGKKAVNVHKNMWYIWQIIANNERETAGCSVSPIYLFFNVKFVFSVID